MSNYSTIHEHLIKLGVKPQLAKKVSKELIDKSKINPVLSEADLQKEIDRLARSISELGNPNEKQVINYFHAILQGLIGAGLIELLVLSKSWLSSIFMSSPSEETEKLMEAQTLIRQDIVNQFSVETSDVVSQHLLNFDRDQRDLIETSLIELGFELDENLIEIISEAVDNLYEVIEYQKAKELGIIPETSQ
ncbi:hypothetical protein [Candidatus Electrothrix sp.]|uniref:hypothetical protein n=1 Tax=Candidatus Electrothrix sp. TaxID=2170559 RepID=UPI0040564685